jgi:hypothetical protein
LKTRPKDISPRFDKNYSRMTKEAIMTCLDSDTNDSNAVSLAKTTRQIIQNIDDQKTNRIVMEQSLNALREAPQTTEKQKETAHLGYMISCFTDNNKTASAAMESALDRIVSSDNNSSETEIPHVILDSVESSPCNGRSKRVANVVDEGFRSIKRSELASGGQKELVSYGETLSNLLDNTDSCSFQIRTIKEIADYDGRSTASSIAVIAQEAVEDAQTPDSIIALDEGFEVIKTSQHSNDNEKKLAELGLKAGQNKTNPDHTAGIKLYIMQEIAKPGSVSRNTHRPVNNQNTNKHNDNRHDTTSTNSKEGVIIKEEHIFINGVKLNKKHRLNSGYFNKS